MTKIKESSLDWALAHVETCGDTDVFPIPFEYKAIRHDWDTIKSHLANQDVCNWRVRPNRTMLAPKARYGFRVITQLDPLDFLVFAALMRELCQSIEKQRVPKSGNVVYSYRAKPTPDGQLFDPEYGYRAFLDASRDILTKNPDFSHVAVTDISDFYSRIYHHRLENALNASTNKTGHVTAIKRLLSDWNSKETYGIPVGSAPCRLLAELTINSIDEALLANGTQFIRFNDDYRIFARSHAEAYRTLAFLADTLIRMLGLTLQRQKTVVLPCEEYQSRFLTTQTDHALDSLHAKFLDLVEELGIEDSYDHFDYSELTEDQKEFVDSLHLIELLKEEINRSQEPDIRLIRFVLHRLAQLEEPAAIGILLDNLDTLYPMFPDIIKYIEQFSSLDANFRNHVGKRLLDAYENSIISELAYHKLWCLHLFSNSNMWGQHNRFFQLYSEARDNSNRRKLILAMGRAKQQHWFQKQWRCLTDFSPWPRRAFLAGASCLPSDARKHLYQSMEPQLDPLEQAIVRWARQNPFSDG